MVCQLKKYIEELHENSTELFKDNPPKDLETLMDKIGPPSICPMIMIVLITKGNPTSMPKGATDEKLNDLSMKKVQPLTLLQEGSNKILCMVTSAASCSPLSSCYKLIWF